MLPGDRDFVTALEAAAPGYMRTAIAGASTDEIAMLRAIVRADAATLDGFRPWGIPLVDDHRSYEDLETARATLIRRNLSNVAACRGVEAWARGSGIATAEHSIPPVLRIGAIAWLALMTLREDEIPDPDPVRARLLAILRSQKEMSESDMTPPLSVEHAA
ncbi:MAG TPA: hypothetical protein VN253_24925 [Kofleriaceae bacterium]|nr:hypothetical protein [Kofleriaceae bacterium]